MKPLSRNFFSLRSSLVALGLITPLLIIHLLSGLASTNKVNPGNQFFGTDSGFPRSEFVPISGCCEEDDKKPHWLAASYYAVKDNLSALLLLNNKGPRPLEVRPTLFSMNGERFDVAPVTVEGKSFRMIDLREWVTLAGAEFEQGSIQVFHHGRDLVLGAQVYLVDENRSLSFEEKLVELANIKSSRLEGLWWLPARKGDVLLALSNTHDVAVQVSIGIDAHSPHRQLQTLIELAPHGTRVIQVKDLISHEKGIISKYGAISIEHSGPKGAVLARGMAQEASSGYSLSIQFSDPAGAKSSQLQGAGLRFGKVNDEKLTPIAVVRNTSQSEATIIGRLTYTTDGGTNIVALPDLRLASGKMVIVDLSELLKHRGLEGVSTTGGLEFEYSNEPGSVLVLALSVGEDGNQVFRLPMWDIAAQRSSTGGYPWYIDGNSSTIVYIKNTSDEPQQYLLQLDNPEGPYALGMRTIGSRETVIYDLRKMRDEQVPDNRGRLIPLAATQGQVHWSSASTGVLIGRSEQANLEAGVSSNYACQNCCGDIPSAQRVFPSTATVVIDGTHIYSAQEQYQDCYGWITDFMDVINANWTSSNDGVATAGFQGFVTGVSPGSATITARWSIVTPRYDPVRGECLERMGSVSKSATVSVKPKVTVDEVGFTGDFQITKASDGTLIDDPDGSSPIWKRSSNPNLPVAHTKGTMVTIFGKLAIEPSSSSTSAKVRVKNGSTVIATKDVTVSGTTVNFSGLRTTVALETTVKATTPTFLWEISYDGGSSWFSMGTSGPHTMYWTHAAPLDPPFRNDAGLTFSALYDLALQKACGYANGASDLNTTIGNINTGIDAEINYNPNKSIGTLHPLRAYFEAGGCQCSDLSNLLRGLLRSIGIDGTTLYIWAGPNANTVTRFIRGSTLQSLMSFQIIRGQHDQAESNPHFLFHAVVSTNGTWYDPSYGLTYSSLAFEETAFRKTPQQVRSAPWSFDPFSPSTAWVCPH